MIHRIFSTLSTFKPLEFRPGLNLLLATKSDGAKSRQTRNRAGKTSLVEIVHFLLGVTVKKESVFLADKLMKETFGAELDIAGIRATVQRCADGKKKNQFVVTCKDHATDGTYGLADWKFALGEKYFHLHEDEKGAPSFRSTFPYFARQELEHGFNEVDGYGKEQQLGSRQVALMFLLGLDWRIARDWQTVRDGEKNLKELKKAAGNGAIDGIIGKTAELRTQLVLAKARGEKLSAELDEFRVLPEYHELEREASALTRQLGGLANENTLDSAITKDMEEALSSETPPELGNLEHVYRTAGVVLPGLVKKRFDDVRSFHESVVRNRKEYLETELREAKERIEKRNATKSGIDNRLREIMSILNSHGALDQYSKLRSELSQREAEVAMLKQRYEAAEKLEGTKNELEIERRHLHDRLRRDFYEQEARLREAILAFETTSSRLYENTGAGSLRVTETLNGPVFEYPIQGSRSKGIRNMRIFCFDMMLMRLCAKRGIGPGFLIHDSHLFDGVDGRQIAEALKIGAETADELGFQYIVTMNEDDAFKERDPSFKLDDYILPVRLTDATEDGGLFGIRFD